MALRSRKISSLHYLFVFVAGFGGALLGALTTWMVVLVSDRLGEQRRLARRIGIVSGGLLGLLVTLALHTVARPLVEWSVLGTVGFLDRPLAFQLLAAIVPGSLCGLVGTSQPRSITATCAACGGFVLPESLRCKHCGVAFLPMQRASHWRRNLSWLTAIMLLLAALWALAHWLRPERTVAVPELAAATLDLDAVRGQQSKAALIAALGQAPLQVRAAGGSGEEWIYPIRRDGSSPNLATPAPLLEVALNQAGVVESWGFFHPSSHQPLPIAISLEQEYARLDGCELPSSHKYRVELAQVLKQGSTTKAQALLALAGSGANLTYSYSEPERHIQQLADIFVHPAPSGSGEVIRMYVDHPSPLFIGAELYVREFDSDGQSSFGYFAAGGC